VLTLSDMVGNGPTQGAPMQRRPVATVPANQLQQVLGAMELLGNLPEPTLQQPSVPAKPVTGWCPHTLAAVLTRHPPDSAFVDTPAKTTPHACCTPAANLHA
jgi:hypothetical protein